MVERQPKITVVGSFNMDLVVRTPRMPSKGETILGGPFFSGPGGKGANQAVGAARLGGDVAMVVKVGTDRFGDAAVDNLKAEGIRLDYVLRSEETPTGVAFILVDDDGENMIVVAPGANSELGVDDIEDVQDALVKADVVLLQLESPLATIERAVQMAHEAGVSVLLNPAPGQALSPDLLANVDILTPNQTELQLMTGMPATTSKEAEAAARELVAAGVGHVVVTLGAEGALIVGPDRVEHVPGYDVEVVDTTGAGDAFNGALAVAVARSQPLPKAVAFANAAAALQVTREGAAPAMPHLEDVQHLIHAQHDG